MIFIKFIFILLNYFIHPVFENKRRKYDNQGNLIQYNDDLESPHMRQHKKVKLNTIDSEDENL